MSSTPEARVADFTARIDRVRTEVGKLIVGSSVHICNECVHVCDEIMTKENVDAADQTSTSASTSREERLCGICMDRGDHPGQDGAEDCEYVAMITDEAELDVE